KSLLMQAACDASNSAFSPSAPSFCAIGGAPALSPLPHAPTPNSRTTENNNADPILIMGRHRIRRGVRLGLVLELRVDDVGLSSLALRRRATLLATRRRTGLLVHRLGELVRRRLQLLERRTKLVGVATLSVALEHLFGLLERFLDHQ